MSLTTSGALYVNSLVNASQYAGAKIPDECMLKTGVGRLQYSYVISPYTPTGAGAVTDKSCGFGILYSPMGLVTLWDAIIDQGHDDKFYLQLKGTRNAATDGKFEACTLPGVASLVSVKKWDTEAKVNLGLYDEVRLVSAEVVVTSSGGPLTDSGVIHAATFSRHALNVKASADTPAADPPTDYSNPWTSGTWDSLDNHSSSVVVPAHQSVRAIYLPQQNEDYDFKSCFCSEGTSLITATMKKFDFFKAGDESVNDAATYQCENPLWGFAFGAKGVQPTQSFVVNIFMNFEGVANQTTHAVIPLFESPVDVKAVTYAKRVTAGRNPVTVANSIAPSAYRMGPSYGVVPSRRGPVPRGRVNRSLNRRMWPMRRKFRRRYWSRRRM